MVTTPVDEPAVSVATAQRGRAAPHKAPFLLLVMASIAAPVYAADSSGDGTGYYGDFYQPGQVPAATATVPPEAVEAVEAVEARRRPLPNQYRAPDARGLIYQPGFRGCAPETDVGFSGGLRSAIRSLPPPPRPEGGRSLRFGFRVAETYTDNVGLENDENAEGDFVTQVIPSVTACANSGRIKASLDYQLQALFYAHNSDLNEIYNNVSAATTVEVLPGHLFLAADTSYGQTAINPDQAFSDSNVLRPGNRTSAWTTNISPYWFQDLGPIGRSTLRYRYGRTEYGSADVPDYELHGVFFNLSNPLTNTLWSYLLSVASQRVERDEADTGPVRPVDDDGATHFDSATLQLGYQATESLQLLALGGVENDFHSDGSVDRWGSPVWNVGFRWTSLSTAVEARYGRRAFGPSYSVEVTHRAPAFDVSLSYQEEQTASGLNQLNRGFAGGAGSFPRPVESLRDEGVYVSKRLTATLDFDFTRTAITLQAYDESREFLTSDAPDEDEYGANIGINYQAGVRTTLTSYIALADRDSGDQEATIGEAGVGMDYQLSTSSLVGLGYSHSWRDDESEGDSYEENRIVASYSVFF